MLNLSRLIKKGEDFVKEHNFFKAVDNFEEFIK